MERGRNVHQRQKVWISLYRAIDSQGNTIEFLLSPTRDAEAAKRFFCKALHVMVGSASQGCSIEEQGAQPTPPTDPPAVTSTPRVINVDKNAAYPQAISELKAAGVLPESVELRRVKYLNNLIEQDHRVHQTLDKACNGLLFLRDSEQNPTRV